MIEEIYSLAAPSEIILEEADCVFCDDNSNFVHLFDSKDRLTGLPGLFGLFMCEKCGLYATSPRPDETTIKYYYPQTYEPYKAENASNQKTNKALLLSRLRKFKKSEQHYLPDMEAGSMLEIGCASGGFLSKMRQSGWDVEGLELSDYAADKAIAAGHTVFKGSISEFETDTEQYDLIVGWMVIEHLHQPDAVLKKLNRFLKTKGKLVISVPDTGSLEIKYFKEDAYSLHIPHHLYHFTPQTISRLLSDSGYRVVKIHHQATLLSIVPSLGRAMNSKKIFPRMAAAMENYSKAPLWLHAVLFPLAKFISTLGQSGRMTVWAEKV